MAWDFSTDAEWAEQLAWVEHFVTLVESFVLGPADVHRVTLARQLLKGYEPAHDLFPSEHLLRLQAAAEAKFGDRSAGIPRC